MDILEWERRRYYGVKKTETETEKAGENTATTVMDVTNAT